MFSKTVQAAAFGAALLAGTAANAANPQMYSTGKFGAWETYAGTSELGNALCTAGISGADRTLWLTTSTGDADHLALQLYKRDWNVPPGQPADIIVQIDNALPLQLQAQGTTRSNNHWSGVQALIHVDATTTVTGQNVIAELTDLLSHGLKMKVWFPSGNEQYWEGSLNGSTAAMQQMTRCIYAQAAMGPATPKTQPFTAPAAPSAPVVTRAPTQPFRNL